MLREINEKEMMMVSGGMYDPPPGGPTIPGTELWDVNSTCDTSSSSGNPSDTSCMFNSTATYFNSDSFTCGIPSTGAYAGQSVCIVNSGFTVRDSSGNVLTPIGTSGGFDVYGGPGSDLSGALNVPDYLENGTVTSPDGTETTLPGWAFI